MGLLIKNSIAWFLLLLIALNGCFGIARAQTTPSPSDLFEKGEDIFKEAGQKIQGKAWWSKITDPLKSVFSGIYRWLGEKIGRRIKAQIKAQFSTIREEFKKEVAELKEELKSFARKTFLRVWKYFRNWLSGIFKNSSEKLLPGGAFS